MRIAALVLAIGALSACASGPRPRYSNKVIDRALAGAAGAAQPSRIVAAEIAFARAARENGQWTAFGEFAADGATIHGDNGPIPAQPWLAGKKDPSEAVQWAPRAIWMSCDGALAVSRGRFRDPDGLVGTFVTVWQRQGRDEYRWSYDIGAPDDPQPSQKAASDPVGEGDIVVSALNSVQGHVADCPKRDETIPAPPPQPVADSTRSGSELSKDGTLRWRWEHAVDDTRRVVTEYFKGGAWQVAFDQPFAAATQ